LVKLMDRRRYLAIKLVGDVSLDEMRYELSRNFRRLLGEITLAKMEPKFRELIEEKKVIILQVNHRYVDEARAVVALTKVLERGGKRGSLFVLGVSGTINKLKEKFLLQQEGR